MTRLPLWLLILLPVTAMLLLPLLAVPMLVQWREDARASQAASLQLAADALAVQLAGDRRFLDFIERDTGRTYRAIPIAEDLVLDGRDDDWPG